MFPKLLNCLKVFFLQDAHKMMRTTAMNSVQIMKEIKDGSKKESIKSVYSFHVRPKNVPFERLATRVPNWVTCVPSLNNLALQIHLKKKSSNEPDNFSNFAILGWIGSWSGWHCVQGEAQGGGRRGGILNAAVFVFFVFLYIWILVFVVVSKI